MRSKSFVVEIIRLFIRFVYYEKEDVTKNRIINLIDQTEQHQEYIYIYKYIIYIKKNFLLRLITLFVLILFVMSRDFLTSLENVEQHRITQKND